MMSSDDTTEDEHPRVRHVLSQAEIALIIGTRAQQLEQNAPPFIDLGATKDPMSIAVAEFKAGVCPVCIVRMGIDGVVRAPKLRKPEYGNGGLWM